jgi:hypothetical protein
MGDGLVVPVVSWLEQHLLSPMLGGNLAASNGDSRLNELHPDPRAASFVQARLLEKARYYGQGAGDAATR